MNIQDWLRVVLPRGEGTLIVYNLYADESFSDDSGTFLVAGYLIGSKALATLTGTWATALGPLDYFHMSEQHHQTHPEIYKALLALMTPDCFPVGFVASVNQTEYRTVMNQRLHGQPMKYWFGSPYSFCVGAIAQLANKWLDANNPNERDVAYVFEAGYEKQGEADMFLQMINTDPKLADQKRELRYFSHGFMDGKRRESGALHAADILAWNVGVGLRDHKPTTEGRNLVEAISTYGIHYSESDIRENLRAQLEFSNFYGDLKRATKLKI